MVIKNITEMLASEMGRNILGIKKRKNIIFLLVYCYLAFHCLEVWEDCSCLDLYCQARKNDWHSSQSEAEGLWTKSYLNEVSGRGY